MLIQNSPEISPAKLPIAIPSEQIPSLVASPVQHMQDSKSDSQEIQSLQTCCGDPRTAKQIEIADILTHLKSLPFYKDQLRHVIDIPKRDPIYSELSLPLHPTTQMCLDKQGILALYRHQVTALSHLLPPKEFIQKDGTENDAAVDLSNVVIQTSTNSGKSLVFLIPILETVLRHPLSRALLLFPTKALAHDQLRAISSFLGPAEQRILVSCYDGDTPQDMRPKLRNTSSIILTNVDMLHCAILPNHALWSRFLRSLDFVIIDEAHYYTGTLGIHVACVIRRLRRIAEFYGREPKFVIASATLSNAVEHATKLTGVPEDKFKLVDEDCSPACRHTFAFWNPSLKANNPNVAERGSSLHETSQIIADLVRHQVRSICFSSSRKAAELILMYCKDQLRSEGAGCSSVDAISCYRGGYTPEERRLIEKSLHTGDLLAVSCTNALELGIDIGSLDVSISCGWPGSSASFFQQCGRVGRGRNHTASLSFFIAQDDPQNQFYVNHPHSILNHRDKAIINVENEIILELQLPCAAAELSLRDPHDLFLFGTQTTAGIKKIRKVLESLVKKGQLKFMERALVESEDIDENVVGYYDYTSRDNHPAGAFGLRTSDTIQYTVINGITGDEIERLDGFNAYLRVHPGAVYLYNGKTWFVDDFSILNRRVVIRPVDSIQYFTDPVDHTKVLAIAASEKQTFVCELAQSANSALTSKPVVNVKFGSCTVDKNVTYFRKKHIKSMKIFERVKLNLPAIQFSTECLVVTIPRAIVDSVDGNDPTHEGNDPRTKGFRNLHHALHTVEHCLRSVVPLFCNCHASEVGGPICDASELNCRWPKVILFDDSAGGLGIVKCAFGCVSKIISTAYQIVNDCPCKSGCPSCIFRNDCGEHNNYLNKANGLKALRLLAAAVDSAAVD